MTFDRLLPLILHESTSRRWHSPWALRRYFYWLLWSVVALGLWLSLVAVAYVAFRWLA
jgi:hypothetical protein